MFVGSNAPLPGRDLLACSDSLRDLIQRRRNRMRRALPELACARNVPPQSVIAHALDASVLAISPNAAAARQS